MYWRASARLIGTGKDNKNQTMKLSGQNVREYDTGLEYKIDDSKTIEVGLELFHINIEQMKIKTIRGLTIYIGYKV